MKLRNRHGGRGPQNQTMRCPRGANLAITMGRRRNDWAWISALQSVGGKALPLRHQIKGSGVYIARTMPIRLTDHKSDRKSTRLNSSHVATSYALFCL